MSAIGKHITWIVDGHSEHGVCIFDDGKRYEMQTACGVMGFPYGDGEVKVGDKATEMPTRNTVVVEATPAAVKRQPRQVSGQPTKRERAVAIYNKMVGASRKAIIEAFIAELDMTPAGASTYYAQCKAG